MAQSREHVALETPAGDGDRRGSGSADDRRSQYREAKANNELESTAQPVFDLSAILILTDLTVLEAVRHQTSMLRII